MWVFLAFALSSGAVAVAAPDSMAQRLADADKIKSASNAQFSELINGLDAESRQMTLAELSYLQYLHAWQDAYVGDYATAIPHLSAIIDNSPDTNLRFRASATVVNVLSNASRNEEAYSRLSQMLEMLPRVTDPHARQQGLQIAANLYGLVGQYELASIYIDKLIDENWAGKGICQGLLLKLKVLRKRTHIPSLDSDYLDAIQACAKVDEPIWTNFIRTYLADVEIKRGRPSEAIKLLRDNYEEIQATHYPRLISSVDSTLARAYWSSGDSAQSRKFARQAADGAIKKEYTEPLVAAYDVLYQAAKKRGDNRAALAYHEQFAIADKGYRNDESSRTLAYQMVRQQVGEKKLQIDALHKQNQVLQLEHTVARNAIETRGLYIVLLLSLLGFLVFWAYRTKRSQLRFMQLARCDSLTGISNRQHFIDTAEDALKYCAKSGRDACVVAIDLDHFKLVNDAHGHAAGDVVLRRAVATCQANLRSIDLFGRLGGEEFGIVLPDCELDQARVLAESLRVAIAGMAEDDQGPDFPVSASFGVATTRLSGYDLRQLLAHADMALYKAKREGRNRVEVSDSIDETQVGQRTSDLDRRRS